MKDREPPPIYVSGREKEVGARTRKGMFFPLQSKSPISICGGLVNVKYFRDPRTIKKSPLKKLYSCVLCVPAYYIQPVRLSPGSIKRWNPTSGQGAARLGRSTPGPVGT